MPSYNHARFVQQTIQSVINQDYANIELIIIDDGSSDDSVNVINALAAACQARFVRFAFHHRPNRGLSATLNEALAWSTGDYFSTIASDDIMYPNKTSVLLGYLEADPDAAGVFCGCDVIDSQGTTVGALPGINAVFNFDDVILLRHSILAPTQLLRTSCMRRVGGYRDGIYIEDWYMWLALSGAGYNLRVVAERLVGYRQHDRNSSTDAQRMFQERRAILALYASDRRYQRSLATVCMWASIDFTSISKLRSTTYLVKAFLCDPRIVFTGKFHECVLRILIPRRIVAWLKTR
ncbi:MAG: glycosyltransferase [Halioglobus sp.]